MMEMIIGITAGVLFLVLIVILLICYKKKLCCFKEKPILGVETVTGLPYEKNDDNIK
jgi:hypothetical protein